MNNTKLWHGRMKYLGILLGFVMGLITPMILLRLDTLTGGSHSISPTYANQPVALLYALLLGVGGGVVGAAIDRLYGRLRQAEQHLHQSPMLDDLTHLLTRSAFHSALETEWFRLARAKQTPIALLMMDIDQLDEVRVTGGTAQRDDVIRRMAQILVQVTRGYDRTARYSDGTFATILPETTIEDARIVAARVRQATEQTRFPHVHKITTAVGIAAASSENLRTMEPDELIRRAQRALGQAKEVGGNFVALSAPLEV